MNVEGVRKELAKDMHFSYGWNFGTHCFHRNRSLQRAVIDLGGFSFDTFLIFLQCFFPQNVVANIQTPTFILNTAYDVWQVCSYPLEHTVDIILILQ